MSHWFFLKFSLLLLLYFFNLSQLDCQKVSFFLQKNVLTVIFISCLVFFQWFLLLCFECGFVCLFVCVYILFSLSNSLIFGLNFCGRFSSDQMHVGIDKIHIHFISGEKTTENIEHLVRGFCWNLFVFCVCVWFSPFI